MARTKMIIRLLLGMLVVGVLHFGLGSFLYYGRIKDLNPLLGSDWVVFIFPVALALTGYFWVYWHSAFLAEWTVWRVLVATALALVATVISGLVMMLCVLNRYGS